MPLRVAGRGRHTVVRLQSEIDRIVAASKLHLKPWQRAVVDGQRDRLQRDRLAESALSVGNRVPDFVLPNQRRENVRLSGRLRSGPVAIIFFRGPWCPYCSVTLKAWQRKRRALEGMGAQLLAISPQTPEACAETARIHGLNFDLLSDIGSEIASAFRVSYTVADDMRALYRSAAIDLPERNGGDDKNMPMPSTYLIDQDGTIVLADVHCDPRSRMDPIDALQHLQSARRMRGLSRRLAARREQRPDKR